ncbi:hypothetical protein EB796_007747 [Bugula neritina]|uniref:TIR domain-containing protein n=1 Tax=Bugula neritina TaxID=10212 RepID=A0A7J7K7L9_BUGNE|nr:hypothetical protein EB796_007747 [Bugula neritina]
MRMSRRHGKHKTGHKKKGMSHRRNKTSHKKSHSKHKHGHKKNRAAHKTLEMKRTSSNPNSKADVKKKRSSMEGGRSYTVRRRQVKVIRKNRRKNNKRKTEEASFNLEGTETSRDNDKKNADKYSENEKSQEVIILIFLSYDLTVGRKSYRGKPGRRMDHYHMRRRFLHAGVAGGALGADMYEFDDDMEENPFLEDEYYDDEDFEEAHGAEETEESESEGSDSEDNVSQVPEDQGILDEPPPLESDDHYHVFFYHSSAAEDQDQIEHYVSIIENSPNDLKVLTSEKDFKADLNATQNLMLAMGLSRRTVLHCTQEFMESDYANYESAVQHVMPEEERRQKVILLVGPDIELPASLQRYHKILSLTDADCFERLTHILLACKFHISTTYIK